MRTYAHSTLLEFAQRGAAPARRQRAERPGTSVPGARRSADAAGSLGRMGGPHGHVRRRRQQRGDVARAGRGDAGHDVPHRIARGIRAAGERSSSRRCRWRGTARRSGCSGIRSRRSRGADAVYTDVWTSMGQEAESAERKRAFDGYQVTTRLMRRARRSARVSCTACRRTATRKSRPRCSNRRRPWCSIRPRTVCTARRRCC